MKYLRTIGLILCVLFLSAGMLMAGGGGESKVSDDQMGELVPPLVFLSSLPEANLVNYEMTQEYVEHLAELGIQAENRPTDFAVLMDIIYGEEKDYDGYTIGWSGRVERLDPDMFIHSINHSKNALPGGNNTDHYRNPQFDALADAQRREMDINKRRKIVFDAQRILAEDVPRITLYSRANVQAYDKTQLKGLTNMPGEGLFNEWSPMQMEAIGTRKVPIVASNINLTNLNPFGARSVYDWRNLRLIYDKLVRLTPEVEPKPWAAESWNVVDDTTIDVVLRSGMKFHDGRPVTVADVVWSYEAWIKLPESYFASFTASIASVSAQGGNTIRFKLKEPYAPFITTTLTQIPILPKHIWEKVPDITQYDNANPIGSGPFRFVRFRNGEELVTARFDEYFAPAKIEGYIFKIYASPEGVLTDIELKNVDMLSYDMIPAHINQLKKNEGGKFSHMQVTEAPDIGFFYLGFNNDRPPFTNKQFRIASSYLIDYDYALDVLLDGYGSRGGAGLVINGANEFWHNPDVPIYNTFDPKKAKEILIEAGFTWDSQGRMRMPR
ncbi:ABC transporter substrate-binding protein [Treponema sp. OttesenSCG-928-L16]|nr:ABC transporter substrate-binding protein [Treponema sp. OttesenSCG-928-L16]